MSDDELRDPFLDPAIDDDLDTPKDELAIDIQEEEEEGLWEDEE